MDPLSVRFLFLPALILVVWSAYRLVRKKGFDRRSWRVPFFAVYWAASAEIYRYGLVYGFGPEIQNWARVIWFVGTVVLLVT